jgi:predicted Zn-dependent protease with MMP-like domain
MNREKFRELVAEAISNLPQEFSARMENVDVVVEDYPSRSQIASAGLRRGYTLLGLYQGIPLTRRTRHYGLVPPDKITIFQKPIEAKSKSAAEITAEIERVIKHEIAHFFGIGDARLRELERDKD